LSGIVQVSRLPQAHASPEGRLGDAAGELHVALRRARCAMEVAREENMPYASLTMSRRDLTFRQGDLSEYLASYLLASLGLITPVPRQEDIGIDFHCTLADGEKGAVTFGFPFLLQTKSTTNAKVGFALVKSKKQWLRHDLEFLFRQELPVFLGIVDKATVTISLYLCAPIWFLIYENPKCAEFKLVPDLISRDGGVGRPAKQAFKKSRYPAAESDGFRYAVNLGPPLITLNAAESRNPAILAARKEILRQAVFFDQLNITYHRLRVPHFHWAAHIKTNIGFTPAYYYASAPDVPAALDEIYASIAPAVISLADLAEIKQDQAMIADLKSIVAKIPARVLPQGVKDQLASFFPPPTAAPPAAVPPGP
jgi:hypothetical protein